MPSPSEHQQDENPYQAPSDGSNDSLPSRYSVPLAIGLVIVIAAAFVLHVSLGIGLLLVAVPSYARAVRRSYVRIAAGESPTTGERLLSFLGSVGVVLVCLVAGCIAFLVTCTSSLVFISGNRGSMEMSIIVTILLSGVALIVAAGLLFRAAWPQIRKSKQTQTIADDTRDDVEQP